MMERQQWGHPAYLEKWVPWRKLGFRIFFNGLNVCSFLTGSDRPVSACKESETNRYPEDFSFGAVSVLCGDEI